MAVDTAITGTAAGVPFLAVPPVGERAAAPVVVAWHLMDPPRSETAFAAALPLAGLEAWRIYLGLPLTGARLPAGGFDELMRLGYEDAVLHLQGPVSARAAAEFGPAFAELRDRLALRNGPIGLLGGSLGAAVAQQVVAEQQTDIAASVLVSPLVQLRPAVEALSRGYGVEYPWTPASLEVARRLDFVGRADEVAVCPATLLVVGAADDEDGFREPAAHLHAALGQRSVATDFVVVAGMGHALAEEPGVEAAPQLPHAAEVDRLAVDWFARHLVG